MLSDNLENADDGNRFMIDRRTFLKGLAACFAAATAPGVFLPKLNDAFKWNPTSQLFEIETIIELSYGVAIGDPSGIIAIPPMEKTVQDFKRAGWDAVTDPDSGLTFMRRSYRSGSDGLFQEIVDVNNYKFGIENEVIKTIS